jgi:hypothetical protein
MEFRDQLEDLRIRFAQDRASAGLPPLNTIAGEFR